LVIIEHVEGTAHTIAYIPEYLTSLNNRILVISLILPTYINIGFKLHKIVNSKREYL